MFWPALTPLSTMALLPSRLPRFQNDWLQDIERHEEPGYAQQVGRATLRAILNQDADALRTALFEIPGPVQHLEMLGSLWVNEQRSGAARSLQQGFDLLRPGVLAENDAGYNDEVMGVVRLAAQAGLSTAQHDVLIALVEGLLTKRSTPLVLTDSLLDGEDEETLRAVVQRLEEGVLRSTLVDTPAAATAGPLSTRPRL